MEISGGNIFVSSADDGVNASDGSANKETNDPNCHIIVSGGIGNPGGMPPGGFGGGMGRPGGRK